MSLTLGHVPHVSLTLGYAPHFVSCLLGCGPTFGNPGRQTTAWGWPPASPEPRDPTPETPKPDTRDPIPETRIPRPVTRYPPKKTQNLTRTTQPQPGTPKPLTPRPAQVRWGAGLRRFRQDPTLHTPRPSPEPLSSEYGTCETIKARF